MKKIVDPVEEAAKRSETPHIYQSTDLTRLKSRISILLPIESRTKDRIEEVIGSEKKKVAASGQLEHILRRFPEARILDPSAFKMKNKKGLPLLAPFPLTSSSIVIGPGDSFSADFPKSCMEHYGYVSKKIRSYSGRNDMELAAENIPLFSVAISGILGGVLIGIYRTHIFTDVTFDGLWLTFISSLFFCFLPGIFPFGIMVYELALVFLRRRLGRCISAVFSGVLPDDVRKLAIEARDCSLFNEIFILAHVPEWEVRNVPVPRPSKEGDPLLVGADTHGKFWLLAVFDTVSVEDEIVRGFTSTS